MQGNIIEIGSDNKKLSVFSGFLRISEQNEIIKDIPLDLILSIIITANTVIYTQPLLQRLSEEGIPLIVCGKNYIPTGIYLPLEGNYRQGHIQRLQFATGVVLQKRLWQKVVQDKIRQQAKVLQKNNKLDTISPLIAKVKSGDSTNLEAVAAKRYFSSLFGKDFKRDKDAKGINSFLNYGYAVIRACVARFTIGAGLCPSLAVKHQNMLNALPLVDDLMEPFRPLIDDVVYQMLKNKEPEAELLPSDKSLLAGVLTQNIMTSENISPVYVVIEKYVRQYVASLSSKKIELAQNYELDNV